VHGTFIIGSYFKPGLAKMLFRFLPVFSLWNTGFLGFRLRNTGPKNETVILNMMKSLEVVITTVIIFGYIQFVLRPKWSSKSATIDIKMRL
jgi:hypothetical protein